MSDGPGDNGLTTNGLWAWAWVFGIVAVGSLLRLLIYAAHDVQVQAEFFVWMLLGTIASVFSACCAVLVGVKSAERRLRELSVPVDG